MDIAHSSIWEMVSESFEDIQDKASNHDRQIHDLDQWMVCVTDVVKPLEDQFDWFPAKNSGSNNLEESWKPDIKESVQKSPNAFLIWIGAHDQIETRRSNCCINYQDIQ